MSSPSTSLDSIYTHSTTATEWNQRGPFEPYELRIPKQCQAIGLEEPIVEHVDGGTFNRVSKLTFASSGNQCVLRVPRNNDDPKETARSIMDQVAINSYVATLLPVPKILAYDSTYENAIEAPYIIQKFAPGQRLDEVLENEILTSEDSLQIASIIADIFVRMQKDFNPRNGRFVSSLNIPHRCDDVSLISPLLVLASFKIDGWEVPGSTLSGSIADLMEAILDLRYEQEKDETLLSVWSSLDEIRQEMKSRGFLVCEQPVLWHWNFAPQNILVARTSANNSWEVTALLDWDGVLSAPRVLTREPPVWLWQPGNESPQANLESSIGVPRQLKTEEETIKKHFEDRLLQAGIDINAYRNDAYGHGRWVRRLFSFLQLEHAFLYDKDWEKYELFINDWDSYCLEHPILGADYPKNLEPPAPLISKENQHWEDFDLFKEEWTAFCLAHPIMIE